MLRGFHYPLTPKGKSTLNPPPPWYYSSDFLNIEFWADPAAIAALLPPGLDPEPAANGHANALFYDWQFTGANEEYLDPARYQYREFFLLVDALFEGKPVAYCPYIFVDNDAAIARGWTQGYPKRLGQVFQTRYYAATGKAGPALAPGSKFAGSLTASGRRLAQGLVTLKGPVSDPSSPEATSSCQLVAYTPPGSRQTRQTGCSRTRRKRAARYQDRAGVDRRRAAYVASCGGGRGLGSRPHSMWQGNSCLHGVHRG